jgi:phage shock protein C
MSNVSRRLYRSRDERMLGGVAGGLAEYFDVDPTLVRLAFVFASLYIGFGLLPYIILWIVVPKEPEQEETASSLPLGRVDQSAEPLARPATEPPTERSTEPAPAPWPDRSIDPAAEAPLERPIEPPLERRVEPPARQSAETPSGAIETPPASRE